MSLFVTTIKPLRTFYVNTINKDIKRGDFITHKKLDTCYIKNSNVLIIDSSSSGPQTAKQQIKTIIKHKLWTVT